MAAIHEDGDRIALTKLDVRILIALLAGQLSGHGVWRQCQKDQGDEHAFNRSAVYAALRSMVRLGIVEEAESDQGGTRDWKIYSISFAGQVLIEGEIQSMEKFAKLARERKQHPAHFQAFF